MNLQKVHAAIIKRAAEENKSFGDKWHEYNKAKMEADPGVMIGKWIAKKLGRNKKPAPAPAKTEPKANPTVPGSYEPGRPGGAFKPDPKK